MLKYSRRQIYRITKCEKSHEKHLVVDNLNVQNTSQPEKIQVSVLCTTFQTAPPVAAGWIAPQINNFKYFLFFKDWLLKNITWYI